MRIFPDSKPRPKPPQIPKNEAGFSLLEVLVAMTLLAIALSLSILNLGSLSASAGMDALERQAGVLVADARYTALIEYRDVSLAAALPGLQERFEDFGPIVLKGDIKIRSGGICETGEADLGLRNQTVSIRLEGPACELEFRR
jgi:prepilin-type N-terminal cleavage/methylation domain-containing protein